MPAPAIAPPTRRAPSETGVRRKPESGKTPEPLRIASDPPRESYIREIARRAKEPDGASYRPPPPAPPAPTARALRSIPRPAAVPKEAARAPVAPPRPAIARAVPPPEPAARPSMPPPVPAAARKRSAPPPAPAEARRAAAAPPAPRVTLASVPAPPPAPPVAVPASAPPAAPQEMPRPQAYVALRDDPVDMASIGIRQSLVPPAIGRVARDVRESLAPEGRREARRELRAMLVAALRATRALLDRAAELTVELELKLRD